MRPHSLLLVVTLAVLAAALPLSNGKEEEGSSGAAAALLAEDATTAATAGSSWPCCDNCGICTRKLPPTCQCLDLSRVGCHPTCKKCVKFTADAGSSEPPVFRCADMLTNFCLRRCAAPNKA